MHAQLRDRKLRLIRTIVSGASVRYPACMVHVAVIGAGISGLAAAYRMHKAGARVTLLEASARAGGVIQTLHEQGCLLEAGPDSWVTNKPSATELARELGLEGEIIGTREGVRRSFILHKGRLKPLPQGFFLISPMSLGALWKTQVLSLAGKLRMATELLRPRRKTEGDESLASFVRRRFGREALERIAQPMVAGIYTADPERLSLQATFPQFLKYEAECGSVIRGLKAMAGAHTPGKDTAGPRYGLFATLRGGMSALTDALQRSLPAEQVRLNSPVHGLSLGAEGVTLQTPGGALSADAVVLALPAPRAAMLLGEPDPALAAALSSFEYAGACVVNFIFERAQIGHAMDGIGAVIPAVERRRIIAFSFSSVKFESRAPEGLAVLRVFMGGALNPAVAALPGRELARVALEELRELAGVRGEPRFTHVASHAASMPQYHVGHRERAARVHELAARHPRLAICGNVFDGAGMPDCIRGAGEAVAALLARIPS